MSKILSIISSPRGAASNSIKLANATGPYKPADFVTPYLKTVLAFIGLTDITVVTAEGFAVADLSKNALNKAIDAFSV